MEIQSVLIYVVITVLMAPLLLAYGIPFILAATLFHRVTRNTLGDAWRRVLACGIAALGIAPAYDVYRAPLPVYVHGLQGDAVAWGVALVSFLVTWALIVATLAAWRSASRALRGAPQRGTVMPAACPRVKASSNTE